MVRENIFWAEGSRPIISLDIPTPANGAGQLLRNRPFSFTFFFFLTYFKVALFSRGSQKLTESHVHLFAQPIQMELWGVIIMKTLIILIYYH